MTHPPLLQHPGCSPVHDAPCSCPQAPPASVLLPPQLPAVAQHALPGQAFNLLL